MADESRVPPHVVIDVDSLLWSARHLTGATTTLIRDARLIATERDESGIVAVLEAAHSHVSAMVECLNRIEAAVKAQAAT